MLQRRLCHVGYEHGGRGEFSYIRVVVAFFRKSDILVFLKGWEKDLRTFSENFEKWYFLGSFEVFLGARIFWVLYVFVKKKEEKKYHVPW